jgi:NitT/TauT family transport system substrate-binding protein
VKLRSAVIVWLLVITSMAAACRPASAQQALIKIKVSLGDVSLNKLIFVVAQDEGIYKKNGLEVDQFVTPGAADTVRRSGVIVPQQYIRQVSGADVPIAIGGGSPLIVGMVSNPKAVQRVIIASTDNKVRWHIISRQDITKPEQLKGLRLGYSGKGAMTHFMALWYAGHMGWVPGKDITLVGDALNVEALKTGKVDAFVADEIAETMAVTAGYRDLLNLTQFNVPIAGSGINANKEWLKDNRDTAARFVKSAVEALALLKKNRDVAFRGMAKWYGMTDPERQKYFYREISKLERKPYPAVDGIKKVMELYDSPEMRKHKPEDFYDDSFVRELDKSGYIDSLYKK